MASKDLVFRFLGVDAGAGREFDRMAGKASRTSGAIAKFGLGFVAAGATVAVESIRMASKFQTAMELIHTQAGAAQSEVTRMSKAVLALAGPTATAPGELAKGLYHLESTGLRGAKALEALKVAAEGAKIGGADLESVTNALNAVIASGISGAKNMNQAMGALNATVGSGDMRMQDLADAMGTGFLSVVKGFGVNLRDAGAALAVFGDNNIRGADAATQLRMAVLFMAKPAASAKKALGDIGLTTGQLAKDMQQGGLNQALTDLHTHLVDAGDTGSKMGQVLLDAFGHKAGTGLSILENQFARFKQKQAEVATGSKNFASDWKSYTTTFGYSWDRARAAFESMTIQLGTALLPTATKVMNWLGTTGVKDVQHLAVELGHLGSWVKDNKGWLKPLAEGVAGLAIAYKALKLASGVGATLGKIPGLGTGGLLGVQKVYVVNMPGGGFPGGAVSTAEKDAAGAEATVAARAAKGPVTRVLEKLAPRTAARFAASELATKILGLADPASWALLTSGDSGVNLKHAYQRSVLTNPNSRLGFLYDPTGRKDIPGSFVNNKLDLFKQVSYLEQHGNAAQLKGLTQAAKDFTSVAAAVAIYQNRLDAANDSIGHEKSSLAQLSGEMDRHRQHLEAMKAALLKIPGAWRQLEAEARAAGISIGEALDSGVAVGIASMRAQAATEAAKLGVVTWQATAKALQISSPSKKGLAIGANYGTALATGAATAITKHTAAIKAATDKMLAQTTSQVDAAISKYQADLAARSSYQQSLQQQLSGAADVGGATVLGGSGPRGGVRGFLQSQATSLRALAIDLRKLRKLGLSPVLLAQIANAGPQQGVLIAQEILSGADGSIGSLNKLEQSIQTYSNTGASIVTNAKYGSTITKDEKSLQQIVQLLEHHKVGLSEASIMNLARQIAKAIGEPVLSLSALDKDLGRMVRLGH